MQQPLLLLPYHDHSLLVLPCVKLAAILYAEAAVRLVPPQGHDLALRPAGDQIGHLWWRLINGEMPAMNQPGVVLILIGKARSAVAR